MGSDCNSKQIIKYNDGDTDAFQIIHTEKWRPLLEHGLKPCSISEMTATPIWNVHKYIQISQWEENQTKIAFKGISDVVADDCRTLGAYICLLDAIFDALAQVLLSRYDNTNNETIFYISPYVFQNYKCDVINSNGSNRIRRNLELFDIDLILWPTFLVWITGVWQWGIAELWRFSQLILLILINHHFQKLMFNSNLLNLWYNAIT